VLERHPTLKVCLSHGGGYTPYQLGRFVHGWSVRAEGKKRLSVSPEASIRRLYFDTILFFDPALRWLIETYGASHVMFGSDYPFDMGMYDGVKMVRELGLPERDRDIVLGLGVDTLFEGQNLVQEGTALE
jgi:aminocarboxymuconate-semialdehyde decarboxylase